MKHGNKLIALLVLILFCMMSFLPGAAWATNQPVDVDKLTDEEIAEKLGITDEEYVEFLERFYNHHFPNVEPVTVRIFGDVDTYTEEDFSEGYIPHTNIRIQRAMIRRTKGRSVSLLFFVP